MPTALAICLEDLGDSRYTQCVALPGNEPGLGLGLDGAILWKASAPLACGIWISADDKLIVLRAPGSPAIEVSRLGRGQEIPIGKPVVVLDQDEVRFGGRAFRIHVHGPAPAVQPPAVLAAPPAPRSPVVPETPLDVRAAPPSIPPPSDWPGLVRPTPRQPPVEPPRAPTVAPIEVRPRPPAPMPMPRPTPPKPVEPPKPPEPPKKK